MYNYYKVSRLKIVHSVSVVKYSIFHDLIKLQTTNTDALIDPKIRNIKKKLLYSDYIEKKQLQFGYKMNIQIKKKLEYKFKKQEELKNQHDPTMSIALKYFIDKNECISTQSNYNCHETKRHTKPIHMPYASIDTYKETPTKNFKHDTEESMPLINEKFKILYEKHLELLKNSNLGNHHGTVSNQLLLRLGDDLSNVPPSWMTDYEVYDDSLQENDVKYGTSKPNSEVSSVPCGGCGALLHCKDAAIPGYLPSELYLNVSDDDLKLMTCQRCHFMKHYNTCLDVKVSAEDYPNLLQKINANAKALVILLVDLTDFPCSIWPELPTLIGENRHVFVVGNKIDLLPKDSTYFYENIKDCLTESLIQMGITKINIKHIGLISAKTGYGVEQLINKLHKFWEYKSDVYLVGCTNAGKSTLFNCLLNSDFCKSQAVDLIHRATTSPWPGTTINLLKFPIMRPTRSKLYMRTIRLINQNKFEKSNENSRLLESKETNNIELATLQSRIVHTFKKHRDLNIAMNNAKHDAELCVDSAKKFGLDETSADYKFSRWCFDTPGSIQPDQILHFLTTDELLKTLPSKIISPRTFCIWPSQTIFVGGLGRLDILSAHNYLRCTIFASDKLPITICETKNAELIYDELLQTEAFAVPINNYDRLKMWPKLKSKDFSTTGIDKAYSASDVVLSSAGWISITANEDDQITMRAWTPEGRGIYLRTPAMLPKSVTLRGMRKVGSPAYRLGKQIYYSSK